MRVSAYLDEAESTLFRTNSDENRRGNKPQRLKGQRSVIGAESQRCQRRHTLGRKGCLSAGGSGRTPKGEKGNEMTVAVALILGALVIALEIWFEINKK